MKTVKLNCASCGAPLTITENAETIICPSCNSTLSIDRGEGGVTLKVIEKLTESIHEMGAMTSTALKESAFVTCIIRGKSSINSGGNRPPIPADIVHSFRSKPSTFS